MKSVGPREARATLSACIDSAHVERSIAISIEDGMMSPSRVFVPLRGEVMLGYRSAVPFLAVLVFVHSDLGSAQTWIEQQKLTASDPDSGLEAFDEHGMSLGTLTRDHADGSFDGTTGDERFHGVIHLGRVSRIFIRSDDGMEVNHLQYGLADTCCPLLCPSCVCFWRVTVLSLAPPSWKACFPLGCVPGCIDTGWPTVGTLPSDRYVDAGILADTSPLVLYDVSVEGNGLRVVKSGPADVTLSF